jgi:hypothetical protein
MVFPAFSGSDAEVQGPADSHRERPLAIVLRKSLPRSILARG